MQQNAVKITNNIPNFTLKFLVIIKLFIMLALKQNWQCSLFKEFLFQVCRRNKFQNLGSSYISIKVQKKMSLVTMFDMYWKIKMCDHLSVTGFY